MAAVCRVIRWFWVWYLMCFGQRPVKPCIGLGDGLVARDLKAKGLATDTIEIDPVVADMAVKYFNFTSTGDFSFLASKQPLTLDRNNQDKARQWLLDHEYAMTDAGGIVITDDYNPMESMQVRKAESYRKIFMERIAPELLLL